MTYRNNSDLSPAKSILAWWEITLIVVGIKCFVALILGCRNRTLRESLSTSEPDLEDLAVT
jgi:hypothetical protein